MKNDEKKSSETLNAAAAMLSQYVPGLSAEALLKALENFVSEDTENASFSQSTHLEEPNTCREAAELLGVAMCLDVRFMVNGTNKNIRYSAPSVHITPETVHNLMKGDAE